MTENDKIEQLVRELWDDYGQYVKKLCAYKLSSTPHLIEDCVQDVFLDLTMALRQGREIKSYKAWLTTVVNNKCKDIYSQLKRQNDNIVPLTYELTQKISDKGEIVPLEEELSDDEMMLAKDAFIATLSGAERDLFYQRFILKKKSEELSLLYSTTPGNVRKRVFRLRVKARSFVKEYLKKQNVQK